MIPAIATALPAIPAAGGASKDVSDEAAGTVFGNAVKEVGRGHSERQGKRQSKTTEGKTAEAETGGKTERKRGRQGAEEKEPTGKDADGALSAADLLGQLLGGTPALREVKTDKAAEPSQDTDGEDDGELQERLVISTVMDLAGEPEAKDASKGQVSLRILKMETHFEPRMEGATLVDPEKAADALRQAADTSAGDKPSKDGAEPIKGPRKGFEEILQSLGRTTAETSAETGGDGEPAGDRRSEGRAVAAKTADRSAAAETTRAFMPAKAAIGLEEAAPAATTGQLISSQVAGRIVEAFSSERAGSSAAPAASNAQEGQLLRMSAGGAALKTLSIQLQPQDLGRLDVSMRLVDGRLSVELAASEPSTAAALAGDRHTLRKLLEHAGFALDDAAITIVARDVGQVSQSTSSGNASNDANGGSERGQERSFGGSNSSGQEGAPSERRDRPKLEEGSLDRRSARASTNVYL